MSSDLSIDLKLKDSKIFVFAVWSTSYLVVLFSFAVVYAIVDSSACCFLCLFWSSMNSFSYLRMSFLGF